MSMGSSWLGRRRGAAAEAETGLDVFGIALIAIDGDRVWPLAGAESLAAFAADMGHMSGDVAAFVAALEALGADMQRGLAALRTRGEPFAADGPGFRVEGRAAGALALLCITPARPADPAGPLAALMDARPQPCAILDAAGAPIWANQTWREAAGGSRALDEEVDRLAREAARLAEPREALRWVRTGQGRRALKFHIRPLAGGGVGVWSDDVTEAEAAAEALGRAHAGQEAMFERVADAVAVFGPDRRLSFHNPAFAALWDLEPAWLAEGPTHADLLDRLRWRGSLPEQADFAAFKAAELARHEALGPSPEALWRLPSERTLKIGSQPHPGGGLMMVFSDVTPELRLRAQFNHQLQVQQATLDKLSDAVAVFGADARLRLFNEAFERFWSAPFAPGLDFDEVVELARPRLHDLQFWRGLRGRITDPDPVARAPSQAEITTADRRIVAHQSRPLPDGATLIVFADVTDTRSLEQALADREAALDEAERLKREFVDSVSHELRTPLTTILGYAELLERNEKGLEAHARGHLAAIRAASTHLARSIDNVLDMAQFDAGEVAADMGDVDVDALMADAVERWRASADEVGVALGIAAGAPVGLMRGDLARLAEMLDHLIENAVRHTPRDGQVTLSAERAQGEVQLSVADTGRGIPFHVQARIFDRFGGPERMASGLGLALVKALVELHGGWVALESEPGAGAAFTCHLPEAPESSQARPELF